MPMRFLLLVVVAAQVSCKALPDSPVLEVGGFQPVQGARGTGPASGYAAPPHRTTPAYSAPPPVSEPTKTIYVNVPHHPPPSQPLPPIAAGPPRKHYKIVFIRAPAPPPPPRPILPPRTEQKTLIYVLHQRPQVQDQQVIKVPSVQHDPEVYFVQYDKTPSAEELQKLSSGNLQGYSVSAQPTGATGAVNRIAALSDLTSDEATLELDDVSLPLTGFPGSGSVEVPFSGFAGSGAAGGGVGVPLPGLAGAVATPTPSPASSGVGIPLAAVQGAGAATRTPLSTTGSSVGVPLPSIRDASASVFPSSATTRGPAGSGLTVIGDDLFRQVGNTGLLREVDDDFDIVNPFDSIENDFDISLENRLAIAAVRAASQTQPSRT